ncbi:MAG: aminotransferase class III-fold pyridoxal phosphate-dependent enzyme [Desulfobacula sp.]|uniref:aspartate aminotransferase family protein n=1 Tax=Desulfobacula sp. TaxID=2593537 RepID=UPI0025C4AE15|nr:aminotransferase class III-fold pyridoxal phosphate-dependent enzyme [Desulfobacula sp.]MCD4721004.1 aminotransferase class III-fold pyridoxal phosphate-dependent enzyme [Desulfobacula sp.]
MNNKELTERFNKVYVNAHSNMRASLDSFGQRFFIARAEGSHMWDADGNEFIDYMHAFGPNILGAHNPEISQAMIEFLQTRPPMIGGGALFTPEDVELGERLVKHIPCAETVKLNITGTDAVQLAIRLARVYTGRPRFIRFHDQYHGWADNTMGGRYDENAEGRPFALQGHPDDYRYTEGKAPGANEQSFMIPFNEIEILEETLKKYGDEVCMIMMEPLVLNHGGMKPYPGYLEKVRSLCDEYGVVLCFDEIQTGFRLDIGGAQAYYGVTPDIATFAKCAGGGLPLSVLAGKMEIMKLIAENRVLGPGTFNGFSLSIISALASIKIMERDDCAVFKQLEQTTQYIKKGLLEIIKRRDLKIGIQDETGVLYPIFGVDPDFVFYFDRDLKLDKSSGIRFFQELAMRGIVIHPDGRFFISTVLSDEDIEKTLEACDDSLGAMF